jgi:predicted molibdopterin-dependent oxidoreductase YjgC
MVRFHRESPFATLGLFFIYFMTSNNILINSQKSIGPKNIIILQYLKLNEINIPRFCYHEKLDIAGIVECVL